MCLGQSAGMVELVDAADSKSAEGNLLRVQVSLPVPAKNKGLQKCRSFFCLLCDLIENVMRPLHLDQAPLNFAQIAAELHVPNVALKLYFSN